MRTPTDCVYVVESAGRYKIGRTKNFENRLRGLQSSNPYPIQTVHLIFTDLFIDVEAALHNIFEDSREQGEWFNLSVREIAQIKSMSVREILASGRRFKQDEEKRIDPNQSSFGWDT